MAGIGTPLPIASPVRLEGRVHQCVSLIAATDRILDVGCSSGWLAHHALAIGVSEYVGLDQHIYDDDTLGPKTRLVSGSALDLPFGDNTFGAVCMFDVMEHLPRKSELKALTEARRVLRPGGHLYLSTPHASWLHTALDPGWVLGHRHYRKSRVVHLLRAAGFSVERVFVAGGIVEQLDYLRLLIYKHVFHRSSPRLDVISHLVERSYGKNRTLGMTVFVLALKAGAT
jgi:SAM-dependent methyltransferase